MAVAARQQRILASLQPFLRGIMETGPLMDDPEACDFIAGNPEVPALPGYVETLQKWIEPQNRRWFAYGMPDPRACRPPPRRSPMSSASGSRRRHPPRAVRTARWASRWRCCSIRREVVFISPPWFFYEALILGANATPVRVRADGTTWDLDIDAIAGALSPRTRIVLINTPNNPTGRIYPDETLARLGALLDQHSAEIGRPVYVLSDEAYSKILFDGNAMRTPARHYDRSMLVHTFSKSALAPAQRLGYLALPPSMPDREALREAAFGAAFSSANMAPDAVMQYALPDLLDITVDMGRLQRRRDVLLAGLRGAGYDLHTPEGTFYLLVRSPIPDEVAFVRRLAKDKVLAMPGNMFEMPGYFRLSITATDEMVARAIPAFERAISEVA